MESSSILIVDDEPTIREYFLNILEYNGFDVSIAESGEDAIKKAREGEFDLAIIDLLLPDISGIQLLKDLRAIYPEMAVVIITGHGTFQSAMNALNEGVDGFFVKPIAVQTIVHTIKSALEKKLLQKELRESEEKYRQIFNKSPQGICHFNADGVVTACNENLAAILGAPKEKIVGINMLKTFTDQNQLKALKLALSGEIGHFQGDYRSVTGGKLSTMKTIYSPIISADGTITGGIAIVEDITEKKKVEEELQFSEKKYRELFENSSNSILISEMDGTIIDCNKISEILTGYEKIELIGKNLNQFSEIFQSESLPIMIARFKEILQPIEIQIYRKDGLILWVEVAISAVNYGDHRYIQVIFQDISERKRMEQQLRSSEEKYRTLFEESPISLWEEDCSAIKEYIESKKRDGIKDFRKYFETYPDEVVHCASLVKLQDVNETTVKMYGAKIKEDLLQNLNQVFVPESFEFFTEQMIVLSEGKLTIEGESINQDLNGVKFPIYLKWSVASGHEEFYSKVIVSILDLSEQNQAKQAVLESEKKYHALFEYAPIGIGLATLNGDILATNNYLSQMLGYPKEEFMKLNVRSNYADSKERIIVLEQLRKYGSISDYETRLRGRNGEIVYVLMNINLIKLDDQSVLISSFRDITKNKLMEKKLEESEARYRTIVENTSDAIVITNLDGKVSFHSPQLANMLGEKITVSEEIFDKIHHEDRKYVMDLFSEGLKQKRILSPSPLEFRVKTKEGNIIWVSILSRKYFDIQGNLIGFISTIREITKQKQVEQKLRESEEKYRELFNNANDGICLHKISEDGYPGNYLEVNDVICDMLNYTRDELLKMSPPDLLSGKTISANPIIIDSLLSQKHATFERVLSTKNDKEIPAEISAHLFNLKGEKVVLAIVRDITERKKAEEETKQINRELEAIFNTAGGGMRVIDTEYNVLRVNEAFVSIMQGNKAISSHQKCYEQFPGFDCHTENCTLRQILNGTPRIVSEITKKGQNGSEIPCILIATPYRDNQGNLIGIVEHFTDISNIIQAKAEAREAHADFAAIFNAAGDGIRVIGKDFKVYRVNYAFTELVNMSEEEIIGRYCYENFPHPQCHTPQCTLTRIFNGEKRIDAEIVKKRKDGSNVSCMLVATPYWSAEGEIRGVVEVFKDISERKLIEERLRKSQQDLNEQSKLAAVGQLAAGIAHELNTPLANINLIAEYISDLLQIQNKSLNPGIFENELNNLKNQVNNCSKIVKDLLLFSKKQTINLRKIELIPIFHEVLQSPSIVLKLGEKNIKTVIQVDPDIEVDGDRVLLLEVFQNLLTNSIDAFEVTREEPEIKIISTKKDNLVEIKIIDNGVGIKESNFPHLFEPFYSTKSVGQGTGLGLSICRGIIEKHNGQISIDSQYGEGTEVTITLPLSL